MLPVADVLQTAGAVSAVVIAVVAALFLKKPSASILYSPLTWLLAGLWGVAAVSAVTSEAPFVSLTYFFFFSAFPLTALLFSVADPRPVIGVVRYSLLALGCVALVQFFTMPEMLKYGGTHWPFADNNSLGAVLAVGILLFLGDAVQRQGRAVWVPVMAAVILFAALMTTEGRAIMLVFAGVFVAFVALVRPFRPKILLVFFVAALVLLAGMTQSDLSIIHWTTDGAKTLQSVATHTWDTPNKLTGSRIMIWQSAREMFPHHPWLGTGIGTFFLYYPEYRNPWDDSAGFMAHNDLIQFAVEMGILAPILAVAMALYLVIRTKKSLCHDPTRRAVLPCLVIVLLAGHSLVNFNFYILPSLMILGLMLAWWNHEIISDTKPILLRTSARDSVAVFGVVFFLCPLWSLAISEYATTRAITSLSVGKVTDFSEQLNLADKMALGLNGRAILQAALFAEVTGDTKKAMSFLAAAEAVNPRQPKIYTERARLLLPDHPDAALTDAQKALALDPSRLESRELVADILDRMGRGADSYAVLKDGLNGMMRDPDPSGYYRRVQDLAIKYKDTDTQARVSVMMKDLFDQ